MSIAQRGAETAVSRRRRHLERGWYAASALYSVFRIALAKGFVEQYGLNVAAFAAVEVIATIPYAIGVAKLVGALVDRRRSAALRWGLVASAGFLAPDVFTLATTRHAPWWLIAIISVWLAGAAVAGVIRIRGDVRKSAARRAALHIESLPVTHRRAHDGGDRHDP